MNKRLADILLRVVITIWVLLSAVLLVLLLSQGNRGGSCIVEIIQAVAALSCSLCLGYYIWRHKAKIGKS